MNSVDNLVDTINLETVYIFIFVQKNLWGLSANEMNSFGSRINMLLFWTGKTTQSLLSYAGSLCHMKTKYG